MHMKATKADIQIIGKRPDHKHKKHECKYELHHADYSQRSHHEDWTFQEGQTAAFLRAPVSRKHWIINKITSL